MVGTTSNESIEERPLIAVSRCLLGDAVRYDGGSCRNDWVVEVLSQHCELIPVCPEIEADLGIPRPAVRLIGPLEAPRALGVDDPSLDVTDAIDRAATQRIGALGEINGMILKSGSPSCGIYDTPVTDPASGRQTPGEGLFTRQLLAAYPDLPIIDELGLQSETGRVAYLIQVFRYRCRLQAPHSD